MMWDTLNALKIKIVYVEYSLFIQKSFLFDMKHINYELS